MNQFLLSLIAPALWAVTNHFNKYLVTRFTRGAGIGAIVLFAALAGVAVLPIALLFQESAFSIATSHKIVIALNGCLYLCALIPFLKALRVADASSAIPILQTIPVFSFVLARIFLGEALSVNQLLGGILIVCGALIISVETPLRDGKKIPTLRVDALGFMLLAAFLYSASFFLFKAFALKAEFWATALWESVGFILFASFLLVFVPSYRSDFLAVFPRNRIATLLMMLNEMVNIAGKIVFNYFSISIPLALAWLGVSFQSVFVLLYGIILTKIFPNICQEGIAANQLRQKVLALLLMLIGACVIYTP